ncbi:MAG: RDD family protein [Eubacterium sp.]
MKLETTTMSRRIASAVIDSLIVAAITAILFLIVYFFVLQNLWIAPLFLFVIHTIYYTAFLGCKFHATIGMLFMRIYCASVDGSTIGFTRALFRSICSFISCALFAFGLILGFADKHNMTVYDYAPSSALFNKQKRNTQLSGEPVIIGKGSSFNNVVFSVPSGGILLGRDPVSCQIVFSSKEPAVSRIHCSVRFNRQTESFLVQDSGSSFGTFFSNGKEIKRNQIAMLLPGDSFYLGSKKNMFQVCIRDKEKNI